MDPYALVVLQFIHFEEGGMWSRFANYTYMGHICDMGPQRSHVVYSVYFLQSMIFSHAASMLLAYVITLSSVTKHTTHKLN